MGRTQQTWPPVMYHLWFVRRLRIGRDWSLWGAGEGRGRARAALGLPTTGSWGAQGRNGNSR